MELDVLENQPEVLMENISNKGKSDTSAAPGLKLCRCVAVCFGLLWILQVAISIYLILSNKADAKYHTSSMSDYESRTKNLTEERDELTRRLNVSMSHNDFLIEERNKLRELKFYHEGRTKNLTEEKDELKRKVNVFNQFLQEGWQYFRSSFYYISSTEKTWQESRDDCLSRGADLMIIDSQEKQDFARRISKKMWFGLTDIAQEGMWQWVDGTPLNKSYWFPGEPNNNADGKGEHCAEIHSSGVENSWNDLSCDSKNLWICEKKVAP